MRTPRKPACKKPGPTRRDAAPLSDKSAGPNRRTIRRRKSDEDHDRHRRMEPQVNGVVRTLKNTTRELTELGHRRRLLTPLEFRTIPCPTYPEIRLSLLPRRAAAQRIGEFAPDALHIATEGPLGMAARAYAIQHKLPFTTAYHTRFPEYVSARFGIPLAATYKFLHWFHGPSLRGDGADARASGTTSRNSASRTSCCGHAASISRFFIRWTRRCSTPHGRSFCMWGVWPSRKTSRHS